MLEDTDGTHSTFNNRIILRVFFVLFGAIGFIMSKCTQPAPNALPSKAKPVIVIPTEMVNIKGGTFDMGDTFNETSEIGGEKPVHSVMLKSYQIGKYEVTFEEYDAFCEATNHQKPKDEGWGRQKQPVINVNWADATAYCQWLSDSTGKKYRLPTEAEWEYAARERGKKIRFGNGKNIANAIDINLDGSIAYKRDYSVVGSYRNKALPVDSLKPNGLGLYNMSGNVLEWCSDFYGNYRKDAINNPMGTKEGLYRVIRGGSWRNSPQGCRASFRGYSSPTFRGYYLGFRVALSL